MDFFVITVTHVNPFAVLGLLFTGFIKAGRSDVAVLQRVTFGQFTTGAYFSQQKISRGQTTGLTGQIHVEHRFDLSQPGQGHRGTHEEQYYCIGVGRSYLAYQFVVAGRQFQILTVITFRFVFVGQPNANDGYGVRFCRCHGFGEQGSAAFSLQWIASKVVITDVMLVEPDQYIVDSRGVNEGAAGALEFCFFCQRSDYGDGRIPL